jgi:GNAT superfamily N-acetyltransferase
MTRVPLIVALTCSLGGVSARSAQAESPLPAVSLDTAQDLFYNGHFAEAAGASRELDQEEPSLAVYELRTSALLFQIRRAVGDRADKGKAFKACVPCAPLVEEFTHETSAGQAVARAALRDNPNDPTALFFLGKLNLNYLWIVLETMGRRTGWNEYWEARHSLDAALAQRPDYQRARVARAWIDYVVDTRMPWGTGWLLGGGNKKKALRVMRDAAESEGDFYSNAEALFGLWEMQVREKDVAAALGSARRLAVMFPNNPDVARFVSTHTR